MYSVVPLDATRHIRKDRMGLFRYCKSLLHGTHVLHVCQCHIFHYVLLHMQPTVIIIYYPFFFLGLLVCLKSIIGHCLCIVLQDQLCLHTFGTCINLLHCHISSTSGALCLICSAILGLWNMGLLDFAHSPISTKSSGYLCILSTNTELC